MRDKEVITSNRNNLLPGKANLLFVLIRRKSHKQQLE